MTLAILVPFLMDVVVKERRWWEQSTEVQLLSRNLRHLQKCTTVACEQLKGDLQTGSWRFGAQAWLLHYVARRYGLDPLSA
jgi:hypothetical protein